MLMLGWGNDANNGSNHIIYAANTGRLCIDLITIPGAEIGMHAAAL